MLVKRFVIAMLSLLLIFPPSTIAQVRSLAMADVSGESNAPEFDEYLAAKARLDKMFGLLAQARAQIDRSSFDLNALLDKLNYDAQDIVDFVKNEIRFEQYPGLLRGPAGTLMNRGGNALDQSVLLAKLLNDAGFEARIASAKLTVDQANLLFKASLSAPPPDTGLQVTPELIATMRELNSLTGTPNEMLEKTLESLRKPVRIRDSGRYSEISASAQFIEAEMNSAIEGFSTPKPQPGIVQEAQDYYWVQYSTAPSQPWNDAHAALDGQETFDSPVEAQSFLSGSVPKELQHQVRFSAKIEQSIGGKSVVHDLMTPWQRPAANLVGVPVTYTNFPDSLKSREDFLDVRKSLSSTQMFFPSFNGSLPPGGKVFDNMGRLIDPDAASNQAAGVFKKVGDSFAAAASGLDEGASMRLTRHWLEFSIIQPGGNEQTYKRTIYATQAGEEPDPLKMATKLSQEHTFMVSTGEMPGTYALDQVLRRIESSQRILQAILERSYFPQTPVELSGQDLKQVESSWWGHYLLYPSFIDSDKLAGEGHLYVSAPQLVMYSEDPPIGEGQRRTVDIVHDQRRALQLKDGVVYNAPFEMLMAGVWDTAMEGLVLSDEGRRSLDTFIAMDNAREKGVKVILPKDAQMVASLGLDAITLENVQSDLDRGYAVIMPDVSAESIQGWWRVNPVNGETLGILYTGQGSAFTEALSLISGVISFAFWLNGLAGCVAGSGNEMEFSCCVTVNSAFWIGGGIVGAYVGVVGVMSSLGAFAGDMVYNIATARVNLCGS